MKNFLINAILLLVFVTGLGLLMYPSVSNMINERNQSTVITKYKQEADTLGLEEQVRILEEARAYNENLPMLFSTADSDEIAASEIYNSTLNAGGNGVMGVLHIDRINVNLPIYHGTSEAVLQVAVGHLPATSLPVGGVNTHSVLSAHTGLPSAKLFTELDELEIGDMFTVTAVNETLVYRVDNISVVEPHEVDTLRIYEGEDYVTLVTCTPYGINSHRLLVRGTRIHLDEAEEAGLFVETDAVFLDKTMLVPVAVIPVIAVYFFWVAVRTGGKRKK